MASRAGGRGEVAGAAAEGQAPRALLADRLLILRIRLPARVAA